MKYKYVHYRTLFLAMLCVGVFLFPRLTDAAESVSFRLYDSGSNFAQRGPDTSNSYRMNENGVTWIQSPLTSNHFRIQAGPSFMIASSSASSLSSLVVHVSSSSVGPTGGRRGTHVALPLHPAALPSSRSSSASSQSTSASRSSSSSSSSASVVPVRVVAIEHGMSAPVGRCPQWIFSNGSAGVCPVASQKYDGWLFALLEISLLWCVLARWRRIYRRSRSRR